MVSTATDLVSHRDGDRVGVRAGGEVLAGGYTAVDRAGECDVAGHGSGHVASRRRAIAPYQGARGINVQVAVESLVGAASHLFL